MKTKWQLKGGIRILAESVDDFVTRNMNAANATAVSPPEPARPVTTPPPKRPRGRPRGSGKKLSWILRPGGQGESC